MNTCTCSAPHERRRVVLTGGPGAGKTAALELIRQSMCAHVRVLPESAGIVFGGGFPRESTLIGRRAAQRAIFHVQRELESSCDADAWALVLCDRGTVDGGAYWPPDGSDLWSSVGTTLAQELARYHAVIHMRTPSTDHGYDTRNPLRVESAAEAQRIDLLIEQLWSRHPQRYCVESTPDFLVKVQGVLQLVQHQLPACCRHSATLRGDGRTQ
jgi:predicted ATPase